MSQQVVTGGVGKVPFYYLPLNPPEASLGAGSKGQPPIPSRLSGTGSKGGLIHDNLTPLQGAGGQGGRGQNKTFSTAPKSRLLQMLYLVKIVYVCMVIKRYKY